ncbi:B12-binding domain-containing radical SAM protein [Verrucomicrobiota bacterium]
MKKIKRVALINVRIEPRQRLPIGLLSIAGCLKKKCDVVVFDPDPGDNSFDAVAEYDPQVVGLGFMTQTRTRAKAIVDAVRKKLPHAMFVVGGVGPTVEKEVTFEMLKPDAVVVGEGEKAMEMIVEGTPLADVPGVYIPNHPFQPADIYTDLDEIPLPDYKCMPDFSLYLAPPGGIRGKWFRNGSPMIMTGRGCPYQCTFCSSRCMFGRKVRRRSVRSVLDEIRRLHNDYNITAVYFYDDTFNVSRSWVEEFCRALMNEPYKLVWGCQIRVNLFDLDMARILRKAGCVQVDVGVESGSPKVLKAINKGETVEQAETAFAACHEVGIRPMGNFIIGCPEETRDDVELTKSLIRRIKPSFAEFFFLTPYPGSELYEQAEKNGWFVDRSYEGRGMVDRPVMEINFSAEEQVSIRNEYYKLMRWRNIAGYFSVRVMLAIIFSVRWCMLKAFFLEFKKVGNVRDAMQAFVHELRRYRSGTGSHA